jgi:hypothetical protein
MGNPEGGQEREKKASEMCVKKPNVIRAAEGRDRTRENNPVLFS